MSGLKNVRQRRSDALSRISWERLEALLATYYRDSGYAVDHCGTGATGQGSDGGIDLKLHKDDQYIVVQCKHWNAYQVPHNDVHQLLGVMINEGATGAILVTSGEFTYAARQAATKLGHVQLIDGNQLREMIGPLPELTPSLLDRFELSAPIRKSGDRLLAAAEGRIRYEGRRAINVSARSFVTFVILKVVAAVLLVLMAWYCLQYALTVMKGIASAAAQAQAAPQVPLPAPAPATGNALVMPSTPHDDARACRELVDTRSGTYIDHCVNGKPAQSTAELRELQRKADEAAKVLEHSTPEM